MQNILQEIGELQAKYKYIVNNKLLSKKALCDLVVPFRDKYLLSDRQALSIVRNEITIKEMGEILNGKTISHCTCIKD